MPAYFDGGVLLREPAWHRLGNVVEEWPGSWEEARKLGGLDWDVVRNPLGTPVITAAGGLRYAEVSDEVLLYRDDKPLWVDSEFGMVVNPAAKLCVQPLSYEVITNADFGRVTEQVVGRVGDDFAYETLLCLAGGKLVIALMRSREPLQIAADPSLTHTYVSLTSRHDGQGGLRITPTNVRKVCMNTHNLAEGIAKREQVGWTIKHTANWKDRLDEVTNAIASSVKTGKAWEEVANKLGAAKLIPAQLDRLLLSTFKIDSSMVPKTVERIEKQRVEVREILDSPTCEHISGTLYGFVQAVDEWVDHVQPARSDETRFTRSWTRIPPLKARALQLALAATE